MNDSELKREVENELQWEPSVNESQIGVIVKDSVVTLTGHVPSFTQKYMAEKAAKRKKAAERAEKKEAIKTLQGIAALTPAPTPVLPNLPTAESILNNMSIIEARKLYDELKKYFG